MSYKYALFDLDGTLADTSPGVFNATDYMIDKMGLRKLTISEKRSILGPPLALSFAKFWDIKGEILDKTIELYREYYHKKGCYEINEFKGTREMLIRLKEKGIVLLVATSKPNNITPKVLEILKVSDLFTYVASPNPEDESSDKSTLMISALKNAGCKNYSEAVMVGDRLFDINGANKTGIDSIGITYGFGSREELESHNATYIVDTTDEIEKIILG